ncbi:putative secreted protein (Por secretion system target) [Dyadobacter jejuensis]|uniref:Putative secreted protein (Por secretion system target) n=1 Tax=Dyadobacter jejuensis TaxID=1082580 RepID=A0A316AKW2_9BACT|nr:T9SS type A sorting domain-containing protein [Dyadobacter jejuensis]PWJ58435.1 putative secreted protein (Por secretion system target) [Dyadobacter jejuensis]
MNKKFYLPLFFFLLGTATVYGQLPEPTQAYRGLWVTQFKTTVLGNVAAEDALINYALANDFNYLICTNMYQILTASCGSFTADMTALQGFVAKAHTAGIVLVSGNVGSLATAEKIQDYNDCGGVSSAEKLDMITYECEFYNEATNGSCPSYESYMSQLNGIKDLCEATVGSTGDALVCEAYIGGEGSTGLVHTYSSEAQMEEIASVADHILLTYYRPTPFSYGGNFFNWTIERLNWIAKSGVPSNIVLLLKSRDTDSNNMYNYLHTYPGTHHDAVRDPYLSWVEGTLHNPTLTKGYRESYTDGTYPWLSGIQVQGFTWFEHQANMEGTPLPVTLEEFKVLETDDHLVQVHWSTLSELQNEYFEIERSTNAINWHRLSRIAGAGTTHQSQSYEWLDRYPLPNTSYYRLKQLDYNGAFSYSTLQSIQLEGESESWILHPNPARTELTIATDEAIDQNAIKVYDSSGRKVHSLSMTEGPRGTTLDISKLPVGLYWMVYKGHSRRFVKAEGIQQE